MCGRRCWSVGELVRVREANKRGGQREEKGQTERERKREGEREKERGK